MALNRTFALAVLVACVTQLATAHIPLPPAWTGHSMAPMAPTNHSWAPMNHTYAPLPSHHSKYHDDHDYDHDDDHDHDHDDDDHDDDKKKTSSSSSKGSAASSDKDRHHGDSKAAKVGLFVVLGALLVALVATTVCCCYHRSKRVEQEAAYRRKQEEENEPVEMHPGDTVTIEVSSTSADAASADAVAVNCAEKEVYGVVIDMDPLAEKQNDVFDASKVVMAERRDDELPR